MAFARQGLRTLRQSFPVALPDLRRDKDAQYWLGAFALSIAAAIALLLVFREHPVPPGGDAGNWLATSLAYLGRPYPSQLTPLAYAPLLFPLIAGAVIIAGDPLSGVFAFSAALVAAFGLSSAFLAITLLKERLIAFTVPAFLLLSPAFLAMFFWGAYPNLLGMVFMNLSLAGLIRAGQGHTSSGAAQFWGFFALAALSHTLVGLLLAGTAGLYLLLALPLRAPSWWSVQDRARRGELDEPAVALRALFFSRGGRGGLVAAAGLVGGYYGVTYAAGVPHPYYFSSSPAAFRASSIGMVFQPLVPHLVLSPNVAVVVLAAILATGFLAYLLLVRFRPGVLTAPVLLLLCWILAVAALVVVGYLDKITTDYHRFGYFLITPAALGAALILRSALGRFRRPTGLDEGSPRDWGKWTPTRSGLFSRWYAAGPWRGRVAAGIFAGVASALLLTVAITTTIPTANRFETAFTSIGHDPEFLEAVSSISQSGVSGGILTVPGADKWARGLTGENTFAPYSSSSYLFYPSQLVDSELAFYALSSHYAVTNGFVSATVRGTQAGVPTGVPDYWVNIDGLPRDAIRISPVSISVGVVDPATGQTTFATPSNAPAVSLPNSTAGAMVVTYVESHYQLSISSSVSTSDPVATIELNATALAPFSVSQLNATLTPPSSAGAHTALGSDPGTFSWVGNGDLRRVTTFGSVQPAAALRRASSVDPISGTAAVHLGWVAPTTNGSPSVDGSMTLGSPGATASVGGFPEVVATPAVLQSLGVHFALLPSNGSASTTNLAYPSEVSYLTREYGFSTQFQNSEWTVLTISVPLNGAANLVGVTKESDGGVR